MTTLAPPALIFFCNSILFVSLFTRLPAIQAGLGVDKAVLGLSLLGAPIGTLVALSVAGRITERLTPRITATLFLALCAVIMPLITIAPIMPFFLLFIVYGFLRTIMDVATNMIATGTERRTGVKVLSRSHGFWSVGLLLGSLASGFVAAREVSPFIHQSVASALVLVACLIILRITPKDSSAPETRPDAKRSTIFVLPDRTILLVCVMVFGICITEGAIYDWGIFFLQERAGADAATAGIIYASFTLGMGLTRLCGDWLRQRYGTMTLVRGSALMVIAGLCGMLVTPGLLLTGVAFFVIGCGIALGYPLAVATTIERGKGAPADNLAALALTLMLSTIGVPPVLGFVAETFGLLASFALLLPFAALSFFMAPVSQGAKPGFRPGWRRSAR
ncbi:MFS transporter [Neorhizobium sp. JUb45]|uniref:MFS transporter n=1 Tax=unclassified Neorhizobium TaxID=2629175 RepID=UPI0010529538|nr:MFS transporter [Neorhizobium sp. JUb45]TCR07350.1 sugar phosphate permease [Neorhizobium sp. JUb45]